MTAVPDDLVAFAGRLADASGVIAKRYFRSGVGIETKPDKSPVTLADREAEAAIRKLIGERYPAHGVVGEEHGADRRDAEFVWVLDPIDGTKSLHHGAADLRHADRAAAGGAAGARRHRSSRTRRALGRRHRPSDRDERQARAHAYLRRAGAGRAVGELAALFPRRHGGLRARAAATRQVLYSGDCYAYGMVASGWSDVHVDAKMEIYDYLAAVPVIAGAGGAMTDWDGKPLTIDSGDRVVAVGDPRMLEPVLRLLAGKS